MLRYFLKDLEEDLNASEKKEFLKYKRESKNREVALMKLFNSFSILNEKLNLNAISLRDWKIDMDMLDNDIKIQNLLFFDTETSHLNGFISSIALILTDLEGNVLEKHYFELNPGVKQDPEAVKVHGLTDEYLSNKPFFHEIENKISEILSKTDSLVAHNSIYDIGVLVREYERMNIIFPSILNFHIDTMSSIKNQLTFKGKRKNPSLEELATIFGVSLDNVKLHNAMDDTMVLKEIFFLAANESNMLVLEND